MSKRRRAWNAYYSGANPKSILKGSLLAWYRADLGVTLSGSNVSAWADQSGTGDANKNAAQGTGPNQPAFNASNASYNGRPTITATGAQVLITGTWAAALTQPFTIFVAGHTTSAATNCHFCADSAALAIELFDGIGTSVTLTNNNGTTTLSSGITSLNTPGILYAVANGASSKIGLRQNTPQITGNAGAGNPAGLSICNYSSGSFALAGPLAELVVATGALSQALINQVTAYMSSRYGVTQGA